MTDKKYLSIGFLLLLLAAYVDNVRGPMLPMIKEEYGYAYSQAGWLLTCGSVGAILCNLLLVFSVRAFALEGAAVVLLVLGMLLAAGQFLLANSWGIAVFGGMIGVVIAGLGSLSNIFVIQGSAVETQARYLSLLHVMYGVGAFFAPIFLSFLIGLGFSWKAGFIAIIPVLCFFILFILRGKFKEVEASPEGPAGSKIRLREILPVLVIASYVIGEVMTSLWMVSFLMETESMSIHLASRYLSAFFAILTGARFLCFTFLRPEWERSVLWASLILPFLVYVAALGLHLPFLLPGVALCGPFFPLFFSRVRNIFPHHWKAITLYMMLGIHSLLAGSNAFTGWIIGKLGMGFAFYLPLSGFLGAMILLRIFERIGGEK